MSLIERAVELLEPLDRPALKPAQPASRPSSIERVGKDFSRTGREEPRDLAAQLEANDLAEELKSSSQAERIIGKSSEAPARSSELLKTDRAHLRRQGIVTPDGGRTLNSEIFRRIKRQILANVAKPKPGFPSNLVLVTSALPGEGKTFCAVSLAISMALEMDRTVLLVDADVANPSVPKALGVRAERGLLDVLLDRRIDLGEVLCKTDIGKLTILPAGTAHPHATELLASDATRSLLKEMAERYHDRIIIFDAPPLLAASEAAVLASQMGQVLIVVEAGRTSEAAIKAAIGRVDPANVAGMLLNKGEDEGLRYHDGEYGKFAK